MSCPYKFTESNFSDKHNDRKKCVTQMLTEHHINGKLSRNNNTIYKPKYEKQNHVTFRRKYR